MESSTYKIFKRETIKTLSQEDNRCYQYTQNINILLVLIKKTITISKNKPFYIQDHSISIFHNRHDK